MSGQTTSLQDALSQVKDFRNRQGRRYQLQAVLALACLGLMHGAQSEQAIAEWSENQGRRWWRLLGIRRRRGPSLSTIQRVIRGVDRRQLESAMSHWSHQVVDVSDTPDRAEDAIYGVNDPVDKLNMMSHWISAVISSLPEEGGINEGSRSAMLTGLAIGEGSDDKEIQPLSEGGLKIWAIDLEQAAA